MNMVKAGIKGLAPHYLGVALTELPARFLTRRSVRRSELAALCNVVRCPAHHEVLVTALEMALGDVCPRPDICKEYDELMKDCRG